MSEVKNMLKIAEFAQRSAELKEKARAAMISAGADFQVQDDNKLSLIHI